MSSSGQADPSWLRIGQIGRPHGVRGELYVRPDNPETVLLTTGRQLRAAPVRWDEPQAQTLKIERVRRTGQGWLVVFQGVDRREVAAALTNHKLFAQRDDFPELDPDSFYEVDLVGLVASDPTGHIIGRVVGFFDNGAHEVCVLETPSGDEALAPFVPEVIVECDPATKRLVLELPEGLPGLEEEG